MESISGFQNHKWCFVSKCGWSILQFLVKAIPLGYGQVLSIAVLVAQQFPCCRAWYVVKWKYLWWTGKGPGSHKLVIPLFIVLEIYLSLKLIYVKLKLEIPVGLLFSDLIVWLPCTENDSIYLKTFQMWMDCWIVQLTFPDWWRPYCVVTMHWEL